MVAIEQEKRWAERGEGVGEASYGDENGGRS